MREAPYRITESTELPLLAKTLSIAAKREITGESAETIDHLSLTDRLLLMAGYVQLTSMVLEDELNHLDFLHADAGNSALMAAACEIACRAGHQPEADGDDLIRHLAASDLKPAAVLQIVAEMLECRLPPDILRAIPA